MIPIPDALATTAVTDHILRAIGDVQQAATPVPRATQGIGYKYADLAAVVTHVTGLMKKHGLTYMQITQVKRVPEEVLPPAAVVQTVLFHWASGERIAAELELPVIHQDPQGFGAAFTYARRYALMAMLGLVAEGEDIDAAGFAPPKDELPKKGRRTAPPWKPEPQPPPTLSPDHLALMTRLKKLKETAQAKGHLQDETDWREWCGGALGGKPFDRCTQEDVDRLELLLKDKLEGKPNDIDY